MRSAGGIPSSVDRAFLAWRWLSKPIAVLLTVQALGVVCSTIYTQSHYAADAVTGVSWALAIQLLVAPPLMRRLRRSVSGARPRSATRVEPVPVPVLWTEGLGRRR